MTDKKEDDGAENVVDYLYRPPQLDVTSVTWRQVVQLGAGTLAPEEEQSVKIKLEEENEEYLKELMELQKEISGISSDEYSKVFANLAESLTAPTGITLIEGKWHYSFGDGSTRPMTMEEGLDEPVVRGVLAFVLGKTVGRLAGPGEEVPPPLELTVTPTSEMGASLLIRLLSDKDRISREEIWKLCFELNLEEISQVDRVDILFSREVRVLSPGEQQCEIPVKVSDFPSAVDVRWRKKGEQTIDTQKIDLPFEF